MDELKFLFEINRISRHRALGAIENLTLEQLAMIPKGFNNNLLWNFGHIAITQQLLVVGLSQCVMEVPVALIEKYRKGTLASDIDTPEADLAYFKANFVKLVDQTEQMHSEGHLGAFKEYETSYGVKLTSLKDAVIFNNVHEGLHIGYMMAMKRCL